MAEALQVTKVELSTHVDQHLEWQVQKGGRVREAIGGYFLTSQKRARQRPPQAVPFTTREMGEVQFWGTKTKTPLFTYRYPSSQGG
jgi:hypothetical protein